MRVDFGSWSLDKQPEWEATYHPECITLTRSAMGGAFQLSSALKKADAVSPQDLEWCIAQGKGAWGQPSPIQCGDFSGFSLAYIEDGVSWRRWFLRAGSVLLRATYNGPELNKDEELEQIEFMLTTLQLESTNA